MKKICFALACLASVPAVGQVHIWTGNGASGGWGNADNWIGGVPQSGPDTVLVRPGGFNAVPRFSVGRLVLGAGNFDGSQVAVTGSVAAHVVDFRSLSDVTIDSWIYLPGAVTIETTGFGPDDPEARAGAALQFQDLEFAGDLTIDGHVRIDGLSGFGTIRVAEGAALHYWPGLSPELPLTLFGMDVDGTLDAYQVDLGGTGTIDATDGLIALGSGVNTIGSATSGSMRVRGNLKLGRWANGGAESRFDQPAERIDVTGELDLTEAELLYDFATIWYDSGADWLDPPDGFDPPFLPTIPESFVLATYGNRVGRFESESFGLFFDDYTNFHDILVPGRIVYTSGENAGPGEIRVVLPEPGVGLLVWPGVLALMRRRGA